MLHCKKCGAEVEVEMTLDYPYYCPECDENMYSFEVELGLLGLAELCDSKRQHFEYAMYKIVQYNKQRR